MKMEGILWLVALCLVVPRVLFVMATFVSGGCNLTSSFVTRRILNKIRIVIYNPNSCFAL